jgi:hypothetical protein
VGFVGVTTATGAFPPPLEPFEEPVDVDPELGGRVVRTLPESDDDAGWAVALAAAEDTARGLGVPAGAADRVETSTDVPALEVPSDPLPAKVSTGALKRSAHVRVSIAPLEPRLCRAWKSSTAARVRGP